MKPGGRGAESWGKRKLAEKPGGQEKLGGVTASQGKWESQEAVWQRARGNQGDSEPRDSGREKPGKEARRSKGRAGARARRQRHKEPGKIGLTASWEAAVERSRGRKPGGGQRAEQGQGWEVEGQRAGKQQWREDMGGRQENKGQNRGYSWEAESQGRLG